MLSILLPNKNEPYIHKLIEDIEKDLPAHEIIVANDSFCRGKGWAIREALLHAKGDRIAFLDADGDIEPRMLLRLFPFLEDYDAVIGSKRINHKLFIRRVISYLSRIYIRIFFGLPYDTQTGIKLFKRDILSYWQTNGFLFEVEILRDIQQKNGKIIEVPIESEIRVGISLKALWRTFWESLHLLFRS